MSEKIKIGIVGFQGKMGQEIVDILKTRENIDIITEGGEIGGDKNILFQQSDIVIDFTNNVGLLECLDFAEKYKKPLVSGSTPMTDEIMEKIKKVSNITKICWSSNMSVGIAIVKKISNFLSKELNADEYDCEILEKHHNKKKDAPSGTAISIGESIAMAKNENLKNVAIFGRSGNSNIRKTGDIGFSSIRGGSIFGEHEVMFIGQDDCITISHTAYNRRLFASGAVKCALKLFEKTNENGFFKVEDLI